MAGRSSTRTTIGRDQASSPPTRSSQRVNDSQSPPPRQTRTTRSQSRDLDEVNPDIRPRKTARARAARDGSADSTGSATKRGKGRRNNARAAVAVVQDLSMVVEDQEPEQELEADTAAASATSKVTQSPGAMSNLSGTTAHTVQSSQKMAEFDTGMMVELIPDLSREASQLLELLAPTNAPLDFVKTVVKELQVPGSGRGKRLRLREKTFDSTKENYTSDLFVNIEMALGRMFNDQDASEGDFRPDVILHAANLSVLVKELLVAQRDRPETLQLLQRTDDLFPTPFLSAFGNEARFGVSSLAGSTFDLALELRTQKSIALFNNLRYEANFDPDELLAAMFFDPPTPRSKRNASLSVYEDVIMNGQLRKIAGRRGGTVISGGEEVKIADAIRQRIDAIRETFYVEGDGVKDYPDFDKLHDRFPWTAFLASVVRWSQSRRVEIQNVIESQGGIENITELLVDKIKSLDSQVEVFYEPPKGPKQAPQPIHNKVGLLPAAAIIPATAGKSLYNSSRSVHALFKRLPRPPPPPTSSAPPSNQQHSRAPIRDSHTPRSTARSLEVQHQLSDDSETPPRQATARQISANLLGDGFNISSSETSDSANSEAEVIKLHYLGEAHNQKENQPLDQQEPGSGGGSRLRFVDPQPNAERVPWSFQDEDGEEGKQSPPREKRRRPAVESDAEDDGFQTDDRPIQPSRRVRVSPPIPQPRRPTQLVPSPSKRPRIHASSAQTEEENLTAAIGHREKHQEEETRARLAGFEAEEAAERREIEDSFQSRVRRDALEPDHEEVDNGPPMSYEAVNETARAVAATAATMRRPVISEPQRRQRWSETETEKLIELIGRYGCKWAGILKNYKAEFAEGRDQGALKDKARNIKVDYLIAGSALPLNFDGIALGLKEREKVARVGMNPWRQEGEAVGEEELDFDGREVSE